MGGGFRSSGSRSSFSSHSSSSSGSSGGWSSSGSRSYGGTRYVPVPIGGGYRYGSSYGYHSGSSSAGWLVLLIVVGVIVAVAIFVWWQGRRRQREVEIAQQLTVAQFEFGVQNLARDMQDKFERMAERLDLGSSDGLAAMLRQVALELRRRQAHIEFGAVELREALAPTQAQQQFLDWTGDARSKFGREVFRADRLGVERQQREIATDGLRDEDGQLAVAQYFVVTVVVAARQTAFVSAVTSASELDAALQQLSSLSPSQVEAVEVVWSPASLSDAMDRDDMVLRYPRLETL